MPIGARGNWVSVHGQSQIIGYIRRYKRGKGKAMERGIKKAGNFLFQKTQEIVPVDKGALKASGRVVFTGSHFKTEVKISYNTHYAGIQHENLEYKHKPGQQAKYVEAPARRYRGLMKIMIRQELRKKIL